MLLSQHLKKHWQHSTEQVQMRKLFPFYLSHTLNDSGTLMLFCVLNSSTVKIMDQ